LPTKDEVGAPLASDILLLLDEKPDVPGWKWSSGSPALSQSQQVFSGNQVATTTPGLEKIAVPQAVEFVEHIKRAAHALINAEPEITRMDSIAGDGDCGLTLKAGAEVVLAKIDSGEIKGDDLIHSIITIAQVAEEAMGGTSGALYSIFFSALAQGLHASSLKNGNVTPVWGDALDSALTKLYMYTRARRPSRTLVDPLSAFVETLLASGYDFSAAKNAARDAAVDTKDLEAKAGRSAYVEGDRLKKEQVPDPGAWGVKTILENLIV